MKRGAPLPFCAISEIAVVSQSKRKRDETAHEPKPLITDITHLYASASCCKKQLQ